MLVKMKSLRRMPSLRKMESLRFLFRDGGDDEPEQKEENDKEAELKNRALLMNTDENLWHQRHDLRFKIHVVGARGVGKTSLMRRLNREEFCACARMTVGAHVVSRSLLVNGRQIQVQPWSTGGQEQFTGIRLACYAGSHAVMLVYSVANARSFHQVQRLYTEARQNTNVKVPILLVGNGMDIMPQQREVSTQQGQALASSLGIGFVEMSAKTNEGVEIAFVALAAQAKVVVEAEMADYRLTQKSSLSRHQSCRFRLIDV